MAASSYWATVSGGFANAVAARGGAISGGAWNEVSGDYAIVAGGEENSATSEYVVHTCTFVFLHHHFHQCDFLLLFQCLKFTVFLPGMHPLPADTETLQPESQFCVNAICHMKKNVQYDVVLPSSIRQC